MEPPKLAQGFQYRAMPGPSVMPEQVLRAMHRVAPNIYEGELVEMTHGLIPDLCDLAGTRHNAAIYISNGHGAWEAALANTINPDDRVLVPSSGRFGLSWADMAKALDAKLDILDFGASAAWDFDRIAEVLRADNSHQIKAILAVHVDTSSSIRNDIPALRALLNDLQHPALLMADCIASLGCERFEMDAWGVDVMVAASQKGVMVPPGLGFVYFNDRAAARRKQVKRVSRYWDWVPRADPALYYEYFGGTAPTHHLYGLRAALDMIKEEGLENVWHRHETLARAIWAACEHWEQGGSLTLNVSDPALRSHAVTTLSLATPQATELRDWVQQNLGLTLGIGLGMAAPKSPEWHRFFRLGHMGYVNGHMIMGMLGGVQAGLSALDVPHGSGALEAAAEVIAGL